MTRALHRSAPRHLLLIGERGVGQSAILAELARRAASGAIPFMSDRQVVSIDCRYVPRDESRAALQALFASLADKPDLVVCVEGIVSLLRGQGPIDNRPRLLAALTRTPG